MTTRNRFILIGVGVLVVAVAAGLASIPHFLNADRFRAHVESTLSEALGRKVTLGKLDFSLWSGSLVAQKAAVADDPAFSSQPFLRVSVMKIRVAVIPFLFRRDIHIEGFELVAPQITLLRAGDGLWNYSSLGRAAGKARSLRTKGGSVIAEITAGRVDVRNGTLIVGSVPGMGGGGSTIPNRVYNGLNLDLKDVAFESSFPFTASARLPDAGSISLRGRAGPVNPQDASLTPVTLHAEIRHLNLVATGMLDPHSNVTGVVGGISIDALWNGRLLHVRRLLIDSPNLAVARAATGSTANPATASASRMIAALSVDALQVNNGVVAVTTAQPDSAAVYRQVNLAISNYSPKTSSPFTLSAQFPGGGSFESSGNAGPFNWQNAAGTPIDAEISLKHIDLAASRWLAPRSGVGGLLDLDLTAASDGHTLNANGVAHVEKLRFAKSSTPSPQPVDVRFAGTQNLQSRTGQLQHSTVTVGTAVINVAGTFHAFGAATTEGSFKVDAPSIPIDQLQAILPSLGIKLPFGSRLQGGMISASLNVTGPMESPIVSGPLRLDDTQLAGFDLGSKLPGIEALTGLHPGSGVFIRSLSTNLHAANGSIQTEDVVLVAPALGSATGSGTIARGGGLDYHLVLKVAALGSGGIVDQLMGMIPGGMGKSIGILRANVLKKGIPLAIGGTTSNPTFTPDLPDTRGAIQNDATMMGKTQASAAAHS